MFNDNINNNKILRKSQQSGGYIITTVYVDGSFWELTGQAGSGVYFAVSRQLELAGYIEKRSQSFPCPEYRSSLGAELYASYMAILLYMENPQPHEDIDRSCKFLPLDYIEPRRRLEIRQDCQKAIRMIIYCVRRQKQFQFEQQQLSKMIRDYHVDIYRIKEYIKTISNDINIQNARIQDKQKLEWSIAMGTKQNNHNNMNIIGFHENIIRQEIKQCQNKIVNLENQLKEKCISAQKKNNDNNNNNCSSFSMGLTRPRLSHVFANDFATMTLQTIVDDSHTKFKITLQDIFDHIQLLENITSLAYMGGMFEVQWKYVKAHQQANTVQNKKKGDVEEENIDYENTCLMMDDEDDNNNNSKTSLSWFDNEDKHGNDMADALAKDGSSQCSKIDQSDNCIVVLNCDEIP